ncbi:MAG: hypothetical protein ISR72_00585 [Methylobacter sp.]|nr:hypothetical protein [Methylobacter sp.]
MSNKNRKQRSSKSGKNRTPLNKHTLIKKELAPPFAQLNATGKVALTSWMNERLPDMIWAALIRANTESQEHAIGLFRRILNFISQHESRELFSDLSITGIAQLDLPLQEELIKFMVEPPEAAYALSALKLFENLPARDSWLKYLPDIPPDFELLMVAVGLTLGHQTQEATDCRWIRLMAQIVAGKLRFPSQMEDMLNNLCNYPNSGDQRSVRPFIRAGEMCPNPLNPLNPTDFTWSDTFWHESWKNTECFGLIPEKATKKSGEVIITRQKVSEVHSNLMSHWQATHSTTAIDAKHDAVFGMAFYATRVLEEMLGIGVGTNILGRLGIRTILEVHINLRYLLKEDNQDLWKKWRSYGAEQAKLNALRFDDNVEPPKYISIENIEQIAGEDLWEEFLTINLGSWSGSDLRKISDKAGVKETYDKHYSWTSGYAHGLWGAIRETCFQTCGNPLHRLHRFPKAQHLEDTVEEAARLVDEILSDLDKTYPNFSFRLF